MLRRNDNILLWRETEKSECLCCKARKTKPSTTTEHIINTVSFQKSSNFLRLNKQGEKTACSDCESRTFNNCHLVQQDSWMHSLTSTHAYKVCSYTCGSYRLAVTNLWRVWCGGIQMCDHAYVILYADLLISRRLSRYIRQTMKCIALIALQRLVPGNGL